ncbi:acyl transferase [Spirosoma sp. SC4-14]|uniref:acyl transferase n=1 Tax=Spirosoma sp. SC4-14 TaxID=3128900 RepID=UPI0030D19D92
MLLPEAASLRQSLRQQVLTLTTQTIDQSFFEPLSLAIFRYQAAFNPIYRTYLHYLGIQPNQITELGRIPFMPIGFFKKHQILTGFETGAKLPSNTVTFASSGTTQADQTSRHYVPDTDLYDAISTHIFEQTYGPLNNFHILALLPSYLERNNSSLVYMVQRFMAKTGSEKSGFFLHNHTELTEQLRQLTQQPDQKKILLIGVTFGLLDWAESGEDLSFLGQAPNLIVMETGGMKGRRQELLREEVHTILTQRLNIRSVHSEYGMTELLSQAYSQGNGVFGVSSTLRILLRDINDPFLVYPSNYKRSGGINVIDLANLDSCSFIETQDLGQYVGENGDFRVIGRFDNSDVRGCNLMIE